MNTGYVYKKADQDWEFDQIARLNYETFVEEIPQHSPNSSRRLVDAFHSENNYFICLQDQTLAGMIAVRDQRPFSLDKKLGDVFRYFPADVRLVETRLLSVIPALRSGPVAMNLMSRALSFFMEGGYDVMIISGTVRQAKLYKKMGFLPFGPLVGSEKALYQPMYITAERFRLYAPETLLENVWPFPPRKIVNFLPGPVKHSPSVKAALDYPAISHRGLDYKLLLGRAQWLLTRLTGTKQAHVFFGSGSLANDVVGGQILQLQEKGLILVNGEFGQRLKTTANGFRLTYETLECPWGEEFDYEMINRHLLEHPEIKWLWMTHLETSTGVLNQPSKFQEAVMKSGLKVCLDCISSIGNVPVDLSWVFLASSVAGKGIGAHTGLSLVFFNHMVEKPTHPVPNYINLHGYGEMDGIPFSGNSNLLHSLVQALENLDMEAKMPKIREAANKTADFLEEHGFTVAGPRNSMKPVLNVALPSDLSAPALGQAMEREGYLLHYKSSYLRKKNLLQICFMSIDCLPFVDEMLTRLAAHARAMKNSIDKPK